MEWQQQQNKLWRPFRIIWSVLLFCRWHRDLLKIFIHLFKVTRLTAGYSLCSSSLFFQQLCWVSFLLHWGKEEPKVLWCSQGSGERACKALNSHGDHPVFSYTTISRLGGSFLLGTSIDNYGNKSRAPLGPEDDRSPECCQRMAEWASPVPGKPFPVLWIWSHTPSRHHPISNIGLFVGLSLQAPFYSGSRRLHHILADLQNVLTTEL